MKIDREPIKNWFGYSRQERRATYVLMIILLIIIGLRYIFPVRDLSVKYVAKELPAVADKSVTVSVDRPVAAKGKKLNLNNITYDTLIKQGLISEVAASKIKYTVKSQKFSTSGHANKVYGADKAQSEKYQQVVNDRMDTSERSKLNSYRRQKHLLEINSSDSASFMRLPGIGPVLSARIIKYRRLLGGFARIDQLKEVYGLSSETYDLIKGRLFVDTLIIKKIYVNSAEYKDFSHFPYFEKYEVTAILKFRKLRGRITGIADLIDNKLINSEKAQKIRPYLRFE